MDVIKLTSSKVKNEIEIEGSKSYANRALILAAQTEGPVKILNIPSAQDVQDLICCLKKIGLDIESMGTSLKVNNSFPGCEIKSTQIITVNTGEGGTTSRFLLALLALGENEYEVVLPKSLSIRPFDGLLSSLQMLNCRASKKDEIIKVQGPIKGRLKPIEIDCSKTTQFATAILLLNKSIEINISYKDLEASHKYIEMTEHLISKTENCYKTPIDMSSAGYPIVWSLLHGDLLIKNCFEIDQFQADSIFFDIITELGGRFSFSKKGLQIKKIENHTQKIVIDGSKCIDLVPTLCFLFANLAGVFLIKNIITLQYKESNRLKEILRILNVFKVEFLYDQSVDTLKIYGSKEKKNINVSSILTADDHRMVMLASLFLKYNGGGEVSPTKSVNKSFPQFFDFFT